MKNFLLILLVFSFMTLWGDGKKIISQLPLESMSVYFEGSEQDNLFLLTPWPYKESPDFLIDPQTDLYLQFPDDRESYTFDENEEALIKRISHLWKGKMGLTFSITEGMLDNLSLDNNYEDFLSFLSNARIGEYFSVINWDFNLNKNRTDFTPIINLINDISMLDDDYETVFSLDRYTYLIDELSSKADYIIIKSYDNSGRHSTFENAEEAVESFIRRRGFEPSTLILAIPLYGRKFRSSDPGYWTEMLPYSKIIDTYQPLRETNEVDYYYFNGTDLAAKKEDLIRRKELAGAALTPINWDAKGNRSLLFILKNL